MICEGLSSHVDTRLTATSGTEQGTGYDALALQEDTLLGEKCPIVFKLPDGSQKRHEVFYALCGPFGSNACLPFLPLQHT